jgi:hypothetical protein
MENYVCPVCKKKIERDLTVFLQHTDHHIIDVILKEHPKWAQRDGICQECFEFYEKSVGHKPFLNEKNLDHPES